MTIVLKLPFTKAASTNGLQRYKGFEGGGVDSGGGTSGVEKVGVVGVVGDLLGGFRGARRLENKSENYRIGSGIGLLLAQDC